ncbi:MAG: TolC family protein [Bdellovibrio sp.]|nr:TolC family protein [Bdellovibrio sp.]
MAIKTLVFFLFFISLDSFSAMPETTLTFEQALQMILRNDFSLKLSEDNLERMKARQLGAFAQFLPAVSVTATQNRDSSFQDSGQTMAGTIDFSLWRNGVDVLGLKAQEYSKRSAIEHVSAENLTAESRATRALFDYLWRIQEIEIKRTQVEVRQELLKITKTRYAQGLIPEHQVLSSEVDLENAESTLTFAELEFKDVKAELERSLGTLSEGRELEQKWPFVRELNGSPMQALLTRRPDKGTRPDFQETYLAMQASDLNVLRAKGDFLPTIDFRAQRSKQTLYGLNQYDTSFAFTISIPIFERLSDYISYRESEYQSYQAKYQLLTLDQKFEADFRAKQQALTQGLARHQAREDILKKGEKLFNLMKGHYTAGKLSYKDLALEQERFFNSRLNYAQGLRDVHNALVAYCHSLGVSIKSCLN